MPMTFEELMQYADPMDIPVRPLRPAVRRRIARRVAQQLQPERKRRSLSRPLRAALIAAAALALLSATAFAAYSGGWFGFDRFFGAKSAELAPHVQTYAPPESAPETARPAEIRPVPDATPEQKARMAEGFLSMPNVAQADPETATAETGAFRCRLESLLATPDTMLAVMRVDALQEDAQRLLDTAWDPQIAFDNDLPLFLLKAVNAAPRGEGHAREYNNGAMRYIPMERDEDGAWFLITNTGGRFEAGDQIRFTITDPKTRHYDLFDTGIETILEDHADLVAAPGEGAGVTLVRVSPISVLIRTEQAGFDDTPDLTPQVELKDGTVFSLTGPAHEASAAPGEYGSLARSAAFAEDGTWAEYTWALSQPISPSDVAAVILGETRFAPGTP